MARLSEAERKILMMIETSSNKKCLFSAHFKYVVKENTSLLLDISKFILYLYIIFAPFSFTKLKLLNLMI